MLSKVMHISVVHIIACYVFTYSHVKISKLCFPGWSLEDVRGHKLHRKSITVLKLLVKTHDWSLPPKITINKLRGCALFSGGALTQAL